MRCWLTRGLCLAVLHAAAGTALAKASVFAPTGLAPIRIIAVVLLAGAAAVWSVLDARRASATAHIGRSPGPQRLRREDLGQSWLIAALIAGLTAGILSVIGKAIFVDQSGTEELWGALTGGAAFTALLVFIPAGLGILLSAPRRGGGQDEGYSEGPDS